MKPRSRRWRSCGGEISRKSEFGELAIRRLAGWYHGFTIADGRKLTIRELCFYLEPLKKQQEEDEE